MFHAPTARSPFRCVPGNPKVGLSTGEQVEVMAVYGDTVACAAVSGTRLVPSTMVQPGYDLEPLRFSSILG